MISKMPMMMNQIPSSTARAVSEEAGAAATTIPAMRLTIPKMIHQALPSRAPPRDPPDQRGQPLDDPGDTDNQADERPGQVQMADQDHPDHDEQQPGDAQPDPVRLGRVEHPDQVEDPREDHQDTNADLVVPAAVEGDNGERRKRELVRPAPAPLAAPAVSPGTRGQADPERRAARGPSTGSGAAAWPSGRPGMPTQSSAKSADADLLARRPGGGARGRGNSGVRCLCATALRPRPRPG